MFDYFNFVEVVELCEFWVGLNLVLKDVVVVCVVLGGDML